MREKKKEEENPGLELLFEINVWNISFCMDYLYGTTINLSLSKLCRKNPIRSVVGWYKVSFIVYFELVLVWKEISGEKGQIRTFMLSA